MKIIECSRDAMQGIKDFIPTETKIAYLNQLMQVGFDTLDCGSFVSSKIIPQMQDTELVLKNVVKTTTKISVIIANFSGAKKAIQEPKVDYLGYPFSLSETFQQRNTNKSREQAFENIKQIYNEIKGTEKQLLVYFSMAFGNPYKEKWNIDEIINWTERFAKLGIKIINLSDTVGVADEKSIELLFKNLIEKFPAIEFGAHFHTQYNDWKHKIQLAHDMGCRRFDGAIKGYGGCPMAKDELVGNMPTEKLITFMKENNIHTQLNMMDFETAINKAHDIFNTYH